MSILSKIFNLVNSSSNGYHKNKHRGSSYYKNTIDQIRIFGSMMSVFSSKSRSYSHSYKTHNRRKKYSSWS
ncbi:hypothetical protein C1144_05235 [Clostridium botulinum]|nr:hypothetical protein C1144_05235 [Clostridium botulinum]